ncbi:2-keto-4-pentenoate hydratase [Companilactobacillus sp.]|uniref:2-keto-4-pentenoate hydratase n=1 Tax=Companilactobacillus sp. TaxID=2767905 RepID=UPI0025C3E790|nr:2-keto-4-pentenoate hydratase [Companilactobacillus sp.]MCH4010098.1 2-keto-4-pentenoate hydratase [Companilactobacillus sp.]MCH4052226.1 2-keto-4-pentenoate hydratase [Companilactobacillus sp.]MCH4078040.1 2-keto-4-pentenoate hydratase [Companilactobacillus sp.]MCH4126616.1 2-keto-4-pentenoate hydratase [Companilactobacillus sp.]MCH4132201.1 2-keto-4-pentenoate hydratase [Companilactobacillus sp.]
MTQNTTTLKENQTTLTGNQQAFANALTTAFNTRLPLNEDEWTDYAPDENAAYNVQEAFTRLKKGEVGGYKVSLTSKETQDMFDSDEPLYGAEMRDRFLKAPANVNLKDLMEPLVEVEMCFRAKEDLTPDDTLEDLMNKTTVAPALEVPDSRFKDWFPSLSKYMVMSDGAVSGLVVYGDEFDTNKFGTVDALENVSATLYHDGENLKSGKSSEVLGNPLKSLQWLVNKLDSQGKRLLKDQRVSSGTFVLPPSLTKGEWHATFDNGLGTVNLNVK